MAGNKISKTKQLLIFNFLLSIISNLMGHGVAGDTYVRIPNKSVNQHDKREAWINIEQLQTSLHKNGSKHVKTWHAKTHKYQYQPVQVTSSGKTNCYIQLNFSSNNYRNLRCSPDQLFYVLPPVSNQDNLISQEGGSNYISYQNNQAAINSGCWAQACTLQSGQILLRENWDKLGQGIIINQVNFKPQPLEIYNLDVAHDHTYLVTFHNIVTHNSHLGPTLDNHNITRGCEAMVATGVLAGIAGWLGGLSVTGEGLVAIGFSTAVGAPVLVAASAVGAGFVVWKIFDWFGHKHINQSINFEVSRLQKLRDQLNLPQTSCGNLTLPEIQALACNVKLAPQTDIPSCSTQTPSEPTVNCNSTKQRDEPAADCPTSKQNSLNNDIDHINIDKKETIINESSSSTIDKCYPRYNDKDNIKSTVVENRPNMHTVEELLKTAKKCAHSNGGVKQFEKLGDYVEAKKDFDSLNLNNVKQHPNGTIVGFLPDGRTVNVRSVSKETRPTLEIRRGNKSIKIRYG